jgi:hypothetical protein
MSMHVDTGTCILEVCPMDLDISLIGSFVRFKRSRESFLWCQGWAIFHAQGRAPLSNQCRRLRKRGKEFCSWLNFLYFTFGPLGAVNDIDLRKVAESWSTPFRLLPGQGLLASMSDNGRRNALRKFSKDGRKAITSQLLEIGAGVPAKDDSGRRALNWALREGLEEIVQLLLVFGAPISGPVLLEVRNTMTHRQLHMLQNNTARVKSKNSFKSTAALLDNI